MSITTAFGTMKCQTLLQDLEYAHYRAALTNQNTSSQVATATYAASGDLGKAIAAATLAQGSLHAPITAARDLLDSDEPCVYAGELLRAGKRVPGFGNSFYKGRIDPSFDAVYAALPEVFRRRMEWVQDSFFPAVFPNAAIITAAVCIAAELPRGIEPAIFAYCRIPAWTKLCLAMKLPKL
jgi:citrate synthase